MFMKLGMQQEYTDAKLLECLRKGDVAAFELIYRRYIRQLYVYARNSIFIKEDCEEILQDIFESLWIRHESLPDIVNVRAYLYQMVKYKVIRYVQHQRVKQKYAEHYKLFETIYDSLFFPETNPQAIGIIVRKHIENLPNRCKEVMKLRFYENLTNREIAERLNIKKDTVENYIVKGVGHLRHQIKSIAIEDCDY